MPFHRAIELEPTELEPSRVFRFACLVFGLSAREILFALAEGRVVKSGMSVEIWIGCFIEPKIHLCCSWAQGSEQGENAR